MSSTFPPEIISDILLRLPVKPLLRFRSVSKPWCALLDSPYFIKRHLNRSILTKSNLSLCLGGKGTLYSLDYNTFETAIKFEIPLDKFNIVGSCNGLLLLVKGGIDIKSKDIDIDIALFNPATRQYRVIPDAQNEFPNGQVSCSLDFGFGYDSVNDDHKVIRVVGIVGRGCRWMGTETKIYSLKTNTWRKVDTFSYHLPNFRVWAAPVNNYLHTVVYTTTSGCCSPKIIVAFNLTTEKCDYIPLPNGLDKCFFLPTVEVFDGMLCVQGSYERHRIDIWVMREYGVNESWFKLLSISPPFVNLHATIHPLLLSSNGEEVLLYCSGEKPFWYNRERKSIKRAPFHGRYDLNCLKVCVDSLVLLGGAGQSVNEETEESQGSETEESQGSETEENSEAEESQDSETEESQSSGTEENQGSETEGYEE